MYVSSVMVQFDGTSLVEVDEDFPVAKTPVSYYAQTKAEAERQGNDLSTSLLY